METIKKYAARFPLDHIKEIYVIYADGKPVFWSYEKETFFEFDEDCDFLLSVLSDTEEECRKKIQELMPAEKDIKAVLSTISSCIGMFGWNSDELYLFLKKYGADADEFIKKVEENHLPYLYAKTIKQALSNRTIELEGKCVRLDDITQAYYSDEGLKVKVNGEELSVKRKEKKFIIESIWM